MHTYTVILKHDNGEAWITTTASSAQQAAKQVCEAEGAPLSAVRSVSSHR